MSSTPAGRTSDTAQDPVADGATYQTPSWQAKYIPLARITWDGVFSAYWSEVLGIGENCGAPSYCTSILASLRETSAVCGITLSRTASFARSVPGTNAKSFALGEFSGMFANALGRRSGAMKLHGPWMEGPANQRPEITM